MGLQTKIKTLILIFLIFRYEVYTTNTNVIRRKIGQSYKLPCGKTKRIDVGGCYLQTSRGKIYVLWSGARWDKGRIVANIDYPCSETEVQSARSDDEGIWECHQFIKTAHRTVRVVNKIKVIIDPVVVHEPDTTSFVNNNTLSPEEMLWNLTTKKRKESINKKITFLSFISLGIIYGIASYFTIFIVCCLSAMIIRMTVLKRNVLTKVKTSGPSILEWRPKFYEILKFLIIIYSHKFKHAIYTPN